MLQRKHIKVLVYLSLSMSIVSIYLLNEAIQTAFKTDESLYSDLHGTLIVESDLNQHRKERNKRVRLLNDTLFQFQGYGYSYPTGCVHRDTESLWKEIVPGSVFVLSAFYDNRDRTTYVRMVAAIRRESSYDLWCHFKGSNGSIAVKVLFAEMSENHNLPYGGWILSCEVPENPSLFCEITLSTSSSLSSSTVAVFNLTLSTVTASNDQNRFTKKRFAVCVPPVFGSFHVRKLVEYFEMMHILGAERIFIYVLTQNSEIRRLLKYYHMKNYAVLLPWFLPFSDAITKNVTSKTGNHTIQISSIWYNGQLLAANDCLYRTMSHFDFTLFSDIDEFLVPKSDLHSWEDVIRELPEDGIGGYSFRSAYFKPNDADRLIQLASERSSHFSPSRHKVMVRSKRVLDVGVHHVSRSIESQNNYKTYRVPDNIAFIHHFRSCQKERNMNCSQIEVDDTVSRKYKNIFVKAVATALKEIERF